MVLGAGYICGVTPSSSKLRCCTGVGLVSMVKVALPSATRMVLAVRVPRSASKRSEAVHGEVVGGALSGGLGACGGRAPGLLDHGGALLLGSGRVVVVEQERLEGLAHVPLDVVGEHAQEDVRPHPVGAAVVDRAYLQVDGLEGPKGALDLRQVLVGAHGLCGIEVFGLDVGTDDVEPVELLLVSDPGFVALEREGLVGDGGDEVLGDLVVVDDLADAHADGGGPA